MRWMPSRFRLVVLASFLVAGLAAAALAQRTAPPPPPVPVVATEPPEPARAAAVDRLEKVSLKRGDTLVTALRRAGVPSRPAHEVAAALKKAGADLRRLRPGDDLEIAWSPADQPTAVTWQASPWRSYAAVADEDGWSVKRLETAPDVRVQTVQGIVVRSLFEAIDVAGETPPLVLALVAIFESDFDFTADTREGDRFRLLVEKRYAGETFVNYGRVLAAQYESGGRRLTGIGFAQPGAKFAFYDLGGRAMRKSFLKSPLEFSRITSGFTYARPHPILGGVRPHLAIDYGAPVGTPVRAVADGAVVRAGWNGGNGIQVHLRHRSGYETLYNHLSRVGAGIRRGARVTQRQVIGYVGATGLATGPHLDYRVAKGGVFVNPMSEKFIPGEPIPAAGKAEFSRYAKSLLSRLEDEAPF
ncbi:MAG TPA: M23 family metallopeptidase [Methylomirabilota bacterium]|nr:M23 family metallopeptidase [Methylomirabilota bacterium]